MNKKKILFVCTANQDRSATAHKLYENDPRFEVKSAGTASYARTVLTRELLEWADVVLVMEPMHEHFIYLNYRNLYESKKIVCLNVPDSYVFMTPELIAVIRQQFNGLLAQGLL